MVAWPTIWDWEKTLQTLTLLLKLKRQKQAIQISNPLENKKQLDLFDKENEEMKGQPASLIVLPTSLVHNWDNEIRKFAPALKAYKHIGSQRKKAIDLDKIAQFYDVILTSYGTVRNDIEMLSKTEFFYLILDESQFIKKFNIENIQGGNETARPASLGVNRYSHREFIV